MATKKLGPEFTYDLSELAKVDPNLIHYEERDAIETGMKEPRGIAVGVADRIFVAGDKLVRWFAPEGAAAGEFKTADEPQCLAVGRHDKGPHFVAPIYVAMKDHVEVYDNQGNRRASWEGAGKDALFTGISVEDSGVTPPGMGVAAAPDQVFVADAGNRVVRHYNNTLLVRKIGEEITSADTGGFLIPSPYFDVAVRDDWQVWVTNPGRRRVELYTREGNLNTAWGKASPKIEGFCGCCNPTHIAALPDGGLVTSEKGLARVKTYTAQGDLVSVVAPPAAFAAGTVGLDVAADSRGRILVLDPLAKKVRIFVKKKTVPAEAKP